MKVSINIFDAEGNVVKSLYNGEQEPGARELAWDGTTDDGSPAAPGVYFMQADAKGKGTLTKLMIRIE